MTLFCCAAACDAGPAMVKLLLELHLKATDVLAPAR